MAHLTQSEGQVVLELNEHNASWIRHFASIQARSGGDWGRVWAEIAQAAQAGLDRLTEERQAAREQAYGQPG